MMTENDDKIYEAFQTKTGLDPVHIIHYMILEKGFEDE